MTARPSGRLGAILLLSLPLLVAATVAVGANAGANRDRQNRGRSEIPVVLTPVAPATSVSSVGNWKTATYIPGGAVAPTPVVPLR
jgi:hypothetical protein